MTFSVWGMELGKVAAIKGVVKLKKEKGIKKVRVDRGYTIQSGDMLITSKDSFAKLKMKDNSLIVLDKNAIIRFLSFSEIKQESGKIYYKITHKEAKNALQVRTTFAIIGIKGTVFIIKAEENKEVLLQKGVVEISSIKNEFELYKKRVNEEFNKFKETQNKGFERYKENLYEKVRMTRSFDLYDRNKVEFDGNRVREESFSKSDKDEFKYFETLIDAI